MPTDDDDDVRRARVAALRALAEHVLGSPADAAQFLTTPHLLFEGRPPLELVTTAAGARRVEAVLWRIEYGLPV